ncbi:MAG: hypothetical protein K1Y36_30195 [Blastocatellia bacterium]|nr:hypothetical protein [Blastocatellia bacterium]
MVRTLIIVCILLLGVISGQAGQQINQAARPLTKQLPAVDRVELQAVRTSGFGFNKVEQTKTLTGQQAKQVAQLWRRLSYAQVGSACHQPIYAIKFFAGEKLLAYASLCYYCQNIDFVTPKLSDTQGFRPKTAGARKLRKILQRSFPGFRAKENEE